ncbi:MAG: DNA gyrase inhibitor YacG [Nitratireductor sp.]|nr:DNA gyrase inhibitor YacG [Nitratireductor sp.]
MTDANDKITPLRKPVDCPNCGKPSSRADYPFCSRRCADVDLNRWFSGAYAIPAKDGADEGGGEASGGETD